MFIVFYGPEGSGKSTQAKKLAKKLKLTYLGSGDLVRKYADQDKGIIGDICRSSLNDGHYVPNSEMFIVWKRRLKERDIQDGWILDGFPRNESQAKFLQKKLNKYKKTLKIVFYLKISEKETLKRLLKRGRLSPDGTLHDSEKIIKKRLKIYKDEEKGVLKFYKKKGILTEINGEKSIEKIHHDILRAFDKHNRDSKNITKP